MRAEKCDKCSLLADISNHTHELALFTSCYCGELEEKTYAISEWLKLASMLENVEVSAWKHELFSMFTCEPTAALLNSEGKYNTAYITELTRFIFTCNALEETYKLMSLYYSKSFHPRNETPNKPSVKTIVLFSSIEDSLLPKHFYHYLNTLEDLVKTYIKNHNSEFKYLDFYEEGHKCRALDTIRLLRNHYAHGTIPINLTSDYDCSMQVWSNLFQIIKRATRIILICIQALLNKHTSKFNYEFYLECIAYEYWLERQEFDMSKEEHMLLFQQGVPR
ncbi:MAG: hypothetical protein LBN41_06210 [Enterobacteriaceae bacterium]|nr:hypothetical protein [Enterobacteriaceae bacterium]